MRAQEGHTRALKMSPKSNKVTRHHVQSPNSQTRMDPQDCQKHNHGLSLQQKPGWTFLIAKTFTWTLTTRMWTATEPYFSTQMIQNTHHEPRMNLPGCPNIVMDFHIATKNYFYAHTIQSTHQEARMDLHDYQNTLKDFYNYDGLQQKRMYLLR